MRRSPRSLIPLALLLAAAPGLAAPRGSADGGPGGGPYGRHHAEGFDRGDRGDRIAELLDLDATQRQAFEQLREDRRAAARPRFAAMRALREEMATLLDGPAPEAQQVGEKAIALHRLRAAAHAERQAAEEKFLAVLSPEQRFAFQALREARGGRDGHPGFGPHRGPGGAGFGPPDGDEDDGLE